MVESSLMSLNIKNEEAHRLARAISERTGESMTAVVTGALRERLERLEGPSPQDRFEAMLEIGRECGPLLEGVDLDHGRLLYDDQGMPK